MSPRQEQKKTILRRLEAIWMGFNIGNADLVKFLGSIARENKVPLDELTDDMIDAWLDRETDRIYQMCTGSVLNG